MATWQYRIQRYASGESPRLSRVNHVSADDFAAAVRAVELIASGMRYAAPEYDYHVVHLLSHDYRGEDCTGGVRLFETADEATARLAGGDAA